MIGKWLWLAMIGSHLLCYISDGSDGPCPCCSFDVRIIALHWKILCLWQCTDHGSRYRTQNTASVAYGRSLGNVCVYYLIIATPVTQWMTVLEWQYTLKIYLVVEVVIIHTQVTTMRVLLSHTVHAYQMIFDTACIACHWPNHPVEGVRGSSVRSEPSNQPWSETPRRPKPTPNPTEQNRQNMLAGKVLS